MCHQITANSLPPKNNLNKLLMYDNNFYTIVPLVRFVQAHWKKTNDKVGMKGSELKMRKVTFFLEMRSAAVSR